MSDLDIKPAKPFSAWELGLAWRYLRARRKEGGIAQGGNGVGLGTGHAMHQSVMAIATR